ncbi:MAG: hypothetical protein HQ521_13580 [Bacteroidetes bacterium]|nr:hypothetical protein [Bacteroidota bacterium]
MDNYIKTDQQLHLLSQIITKANRTFVSPRLDDSHTNLYFDFLGNRILGRWIKSSNGKAIMSLNLDNLTYEWLNSSQNAIASFNAVGRTIIEIEDEISNHLSEIGLAKDGFTDKLHFKIPEYSFADEAIESIPANDLNQWRHFRNMANKACSFLLGYLQIEGEIRIWPHHFDTGIYVVTEKGMGIGFGLAMEDRLIGAPYFYMSGYPAKGSIEFNNLPEFSIGKWETSPNWQGAVLPLDKLSDISRELQIEAVNSYMVKAVNWYLS